MLEENKTDILSKNYLFNKRKHARQKNRDLAIKHRIFLVACLCGLILMIGVYFYLPVSNVYSVKVTGNQYFDDEYYIELSKITDGDKYWLVNLNQAKKRLEESKIVASAKVIRNNHHMIDLEIKENIAIGYVYGEKPELVLSDGTLIEFKDEYLNLISEIPYIDGFTAEELAVIAKDFNKLDVNMVNEISEIHRYPFSYDDQMMEIVMRDGNYVYVSHFGLYLLNEYYTVKSGIKDKNQDVCIFFDEVTNSGYTSECPFWKTETDETTEETAEETTEENAETDED